MSTLNEWRAMVPTIPECQAFMAKVNDARAKMNLDEIDYLDFDSAQPMSPRQCLSATNLFTPAGSAGVGNDYVRMRYRSDADDMVAALGTRKDNDNVDSVCVLIPQEIKAVTDPFDKISQLSGDDYDTARMELREVLVAAGAVDG